MSREKRWTKGEFKAHERMKECVTFIAADGHEENLFTENPDGYFCCQSEHDANLLSASKEMVEALEAAEKYIKTYCVASSDIRAVLDSALDKAYGESEGS